jgi:hypothetical protein
MSRLTEEEIIEAITTAKIANAAITTALIADANITTAKIGSAQITTALIADAQITGAKIASATITDANIASATITNASIANATITSAKIASLDVTKLNAGTISVAISLTSPSITSTSDSNVIQLGVTAGILDVIGSIAKTRITQGEIKCTVNSTSEATFISGSTLSMDNTSGVGVIALDTFGNDNLSGRLWLGNSSGSIKWRAGRMSDGNFGTIYDETHFGLMAASNHKKTVWGNTTFSSGQRTISTGLSSIEFAIATCIQNGTASEYCESDSPSGGSVNFRSSNASSSSFFFWWAAGNP